MATLSKTHWSINLAIIVRLFFFLVTSNSIFAQAIAKADTIGKIIIRGTVTGTSYADSTYIEKVKFCTVWLKETKADTVVVVAITDTQGRYELDVPAYIQFSQDYTLGFSYLGYHKFELILDKLQGNLNYDVQLKGKYLEPCFDYGEFFNNPKRTKQQAKKRKKK